MANIDAHHAAEMTPEALHAFDAKYGMTYYGVNGKPVRAEDITSPWSFQSSLDEVHYQVNGPHTMTPDDEEKTDKMLESFGLTRESPEVTHAYGLISDDQIRYRTATYIKQQLRIIKYWQDQAELEEQFTRQGEK